MRKRIGLIVVATALAFASCEVIARLLFPAPPDPTREPQIVYRVDPEIRYTLLPNQRGWVDDGFVTTNSFGFRGREVRVPKPAGVFRVIVLGDSVAFGWGVHDAETFCSRAEQLLQARMPGRAVEFVNLAVPGYDTRQEVRLLERHAARLEPDVVLVGFYTNDVPDALENLRPGEEGGTRIAATDVRAEQILRMNPAPATWWERQVRRSRAIYTAGHSIKRLVQRGEGKRGSSIELDMLENRESAQLATAWDRIAGDLAELRAAATAQFQVGILVLPPREQVFGMFADSQYQKRVRDIAATLGFFVIDPLPSMARIGAGRNALFIPYDRNHPSAVGHNVIAQSIAEHLDHDGFAARSER